MINADHPSHLRALGERNPRRHDEEMRSDIMCYMLAGQLSSILLALFPLNAAAHVLSNIHNPWTVQYWKYRPLRYVYGLTMI